ncbi:MAG TPA: hypothetical protein VGI33_02100 [Paenibacillus sp.]|jgi:hypothetical protein
MIRSSCVAGFVWTYDFLGPKEGDNNLQEYGVEQAFESTVMYSMEQVRCNGCINEAKSE